MAIAILLFAALSICLYVAIHRFWTNDTSDETIKYADTVATRIGVIHAVVIGMMFTSVRIEYNEMITAIESEASTIVRLYNELDRRGQDTSGETKERLLHYLRFVTEEQWPALRDMTFGADEQHLGGRALVDAIWKDLDQLEYLPGDLNLKNLLSQIEHHKAMRLFDAQGKLLPAFWYIAFIGYFLTLLTLYLPPPTTRRCILVSLYSSMVGVVLLGIFILTHPYSPAAGIDPDVFTWLLDASQHQ
ncbi:MAG: DUF4239 domain-containing protein [Desulfobacterales bacterium]